MKTNNLTRHTLKSTKREEKTTIILFIIPVLLLISIFIIYPIINSISLSFVKWNGIDPVKRFIGLSNWKKLLHDKIFFSAILNNFKIVIFSILIQLSIGLGLAVLLDKGGKKLSIFKTVYFFPMLMSSVAIGILFKYIYDPQFGVVTTILDSLGLHSLAKSWLGDPKLALGSVIAVICWQFIPFYMIYFLAAMAGIPKELHEASVIDGATEWQYFCKVLLPLLKGSIRTAAILSLVGSLKYFDLIYVMTGGGPTHSTELMATYMYKNAFAKYKMGYGSTIAVALFIIVMTFSVLTTYITRSREEA